MTPKTKKKKVNQPVPRSPALRIMKPIEVKPSKPLIPPNPSLRLYRRIAGGFIGVVVILILVVLTLSTTKAVIRITPQPRSVEVSFLADVVKENPTAGQVIGAVATQSFEKTVSVPISSTQKEVLDKSGGEVTIINESTRNQPLVATTRLLSSSGVLFRLDDGVTVPAGGRVTAVVHADQEGPTGDIGPDKFTIPGLATALQSQIYAESTTAMTGGKKMVGIISQDDLNNAFTVAYDELAASAKEQLKNMTGVGYTGEAYAIVIDKKETTDKVGDVKDAISVTMAVTVDAAFFNAKDTNDLLSNKLYENLEDGFTFSDEKEVIDAAGYIKPEGTFVLTGLNSTTATAAIRITAKKDSLVSASHSFLQPDSFAKKTSAEIKSYLVSAGLASDVSVIIFPPWNKRVTSMLDHITVQVVQ
ncbi:MAG: hypothetical protein WC702_04355 [Patescibacteria group bacterium]|jgi:hypothetical protein